MKPLMQAVRGMHDIIPPQTFQWQRLEEAIHQIMDCYGYQEIRLPMVEATELFKRSIGEITDIVSKEMYTFSDINGDSLTLRPEGTAGCVRAVINNGLLDVPRRLWYRGAMFRRERPQKGRYRQFHQVGAEVFGLAGPDIDIELILMTARLWKNLGLKNLQLQINTLGTPEERLNYRKILVAYFQEHYSELDAESQQRLEHNPLRILDSKNPNLQSLIANAPQLIEHLGAQSRAHFTALCEGLISCNVNYTINPHLVRGLDYYTLTVFEWVSDQLGTQGTVCAGGRYDGLVEQLGARATCAMGYAMGLERIIALLEQQDHDELLEPSNNIDVYLVMVGTLALERGLVIAEQIRDAIPALRLQIHCGGGSAKSQFKKANRSGARYALVLGEGEIERKAIGLKPLRTDEPQRDLPLEGIGAALEELYSDGLN
ncbi:histidinol dehydrogenase [Achromatium sp. WMS3]|nr:histidinol dehydrogenase [Achromatium sp. WMS3]